MVLPPLDFESSASAISPPRRIASKLGVKLYQKTCGYKQKVAPVGLGAHLRLGAIKPAQATRFRCFLKVFCREVALECGGLTPL